jgi:hypothetical protein
MASVAYFEPPFDHRPGHVSLNVNIGRKPGISQLSLDLIQTEVGSEGPLDIVGVRPAFTGFGSDDVRILGEVGQQSFLIVELVGVTNRRDDLEWLCHLGGSFLTGSSLSAATRSRRLS